MLRHVVQGFDARVGFAEAVMIRDLLPTSS